MAGGNALKAHGATCPVGANRLLMQARAKGRTLLCRKLSCTPWTPHSRSCDWKAITIEGPIASTGRWQLYSRMGRNRVKNTASRLTQHRVTTRHLGTAGHSRCTTGSCRLRKDKGLSRRAEEAVVDRFAELSLTLVDGHGRIASLSGQTATCLRLHDCHGQSPMPSSMRCFVCCLQGGKGGHYGRGRAKLIVSLWRWDRQKQGVEDCSNPPSGIGHFAG